MNEESQKVPTYVLYKRLEELSEAVTGKHGKFMREFTMHVPPDPARDADLVLAEAGERLKRFSDWSRETRNLLTLICQEFNRLEREGYALHRSYLPEKIRRLLKDYDTGKMYV